MTWLDWLIVLAPMTALTVVALRSSRYTRGVSDFLAAGRIAGRYVISVGSMASCLSVITLVAGTEMYYQTGFAVSFWTMISGTVFTFLTMYGYVFYRWRETRCLSMGQFLELRYGSRFFRIFCAVLRSLAEMVANAIGPAIATNFFIYYLGLPHRVMIFGVGIPCYLLIVMLCLTLAMVFIWPGGRISLVITDCFQGLLCYPIFVIIVGYVILHFSWFDEIVPVMANRVPGQSFMNPYDVSQFRDFNVFALVVTLLATVLNRGAWIGNDTSACGKTAHEQKMAAMLGGWREGFSQIMILMLAILVIAFMNNPKFAEKTPRFKVSSTEVRQILSGRILEEVVPDQEVRARVMHEIRRIPGRFSAADWKGPFSQQRNPDTPYLETVRRTLGDAPEERYWFQKFRSLYNQMMMPTLVSRLFPIGLLGIFCLLMVMLLVSTDDSRIFNASSTLAQDVFLPMFRKRLDTRKHLLLLRLTSLGVAVFFLVVSLFFSQLDYINMFTTIMSAVWCGGAGPVIIFGLYSRFGNIYGAWAAIILGSGTSFAGLVLQRNWAQSVYPFLEHAGLTEGLDSLLRGVSSPFNPWVVWKMDPVKFPVNSFEIYFISMVLSVGGYILFSCLFGKPFDLDRLLHRGIHSDAPAAPAPPGRTHAFRKAFGNLVGITKEYTRGDKAIAWLVFGYSIVYRTGIAFLGILVWNAFSPWPLKWWSVAFFITILLVPGIVGVASTVWFLIGGIHDSRQLFIDLAKRVEDPDDNGQVLK